MANLILKPNSATGDKLIIQDRAGGAVLTTADSGIDSATSIVATKTGTETLTNKTFTSPTLNSPTLVTPALGTPASGTLTNASLTFPDGHIVQVKSAYDSDRSTFGVNENVVPVTHMKVTITPTSATNTMFVQGVMWMGQTNFNGGPGLRRYTTSQGFAAGSPVGAHGHGASNPYVTTNNFMNMDDSLAGVHSIFPVPFSYFDNGYDTTSEINYQIYCHGAGAGGSQTWYINRTQHSASNSAVTSMINVFEIQGTVTPT